MALWDKYQYTPGLTFRSKTSAHQEIIRGRVDIYAQTGQKIDEVRELVAVFGTHNGEYNYTNPDGQTDVAADIRGHFFDLDQWADENDLTADERDLAAKKLLHACDKFPEYIWLHSKTPAARPWPKYDDAHHNQVAVLADQLGLVAEALVYEQENKKRATVIEKLQELLTKSADAVVAEDALTAA